MCTGWFHTFISSWEIKIWYNFIKIVQFVNQSIQRPETRECACRNSILCDKISRAQLRSWHSYILCGSEFDWIWMKMFIELPNYCQMNMPSHIINYIYSESFSQEKRWRTKNLISWLLWYWWMLLCCRGNHKIWLFPIIRAPVSAFRFAMDIWWRINFLGFDPKVLTIAQSNMWHLCFHLKCKTFNFGNRQFPRINIHHPPFLMECGVNSGLVQQNEISNE